MITAKYTFRMYAGSVLRRAACLFLKSSDNSVFARNYTVVASRIFRKALQNGTLVSYDIEKDLYKVSEQKQSIYVARRMRLEMQMNGIRKRQETLSHTYLQGLVDLTHGDVVVDCGAHIGEFSLHCAAKGARIFSFEPDPTEFRALTANAADLSIQPVNKALSNKNGIFSFFDANDEGDSSLIDPGSAVSVLEVEAITLDHFMAEHYPDGFIKCIKLEAEGGEPEVVQGAHETLKRTRYVAADVGPERGTSKNTTLADVANQVYELNFRMLQFGSHHHVAIFENQDLIEQEK